MRRRSRREVRLADRDRADLRQQEAIARLRAGFRAYQPSADPCGEPYFGPIRATEEEAAEDARSRPGSFVIRPDTRRPASASVDTADRPVVSIWGEDVRFRSAIVV